MRKIQAKTINVRAITFWRGQAVKRIAAVANLPISIICIERAISRIMRRYGCRDVEIHGETAEKSNSDYGIGPRTQMRPSRFYGAKLSRLGFATPRARARAYALRVSRPEPPNVRVFGSIRPRRVRNPIGVPLRFDPIGPSALCRSRSYNKR